jgi:hypothetical protein
VPTGYDSAQAREQSLLVQLELLERDPELAVVADVIGAVRHGGRLLAIQGPPGIGNPAVAGGEDASRDVARVVSNVSVLCRRRVVRLEREQFRQARSLRVVHDSPASGSRMPKSINERSFMPCGKRPTPPSASAVADRGQLLGQAATEGRHECEEA